MHAKCSNKLQLQYLTYHVKIQTALSRVTERRFIFSGVRKHMTCYTFIPGVGYFTSHSIERINGNILSQLFQFFLLTVYNLLHLI